MPPPPTPRERPKRRSLRTYFDGANISRLNLDWAMSILSPDQELRTDLRILRGRARELVRNNDYARRFMHLVVANVVGPKGITLQPDVRTPRGKEDENANEILRAGWADWGRKGNCSVDGMSTWQDLQVLIAKTWATDGEVLIRLWRGKGSHGLQVQMLDVDQLWLDTTLTSFNGNQVRMGVEIDTFGKPLAYHITRIHPSEGGGIQALRIPANEIIHAFVPTRPGQSRGLPPMHTAMKSLNMNDGYQEAELVAARIGAATIGTIESDFGETYEGEGRLASYQDPNNLDPGNAQAPMPPVLSGEPGTWQALPPGYQAKLHKAEHPTTAYAAFQKAILRSVASGLGVSYNGLANDLEGVNFSSIRQGVLDERDQWKMLQAWAVDHICQPIYEAWLEMAVLSGRLQLPVLSGDLSRYMTPRWRPRRWSWVDPLKDSSAADLDVSKGFRTYEDIAADQGRDWEEVFEQAAKEKKRMQELGLDFTGVPPAKELTAATEKDPAAGAPANPDPKEGDDAAA